MNNTTNTFHLGQIARGVRAGRFVILAFRKVADAPMVQIKPIDDDGAWSRGEFALPYDAIVAE